MFLPCSYLVLALARDDRTRITVQMKQIQNSIGDATLETVGSIIELATNAESLWKHMTTIERRDLLDKLLSNRWLNGVTVEYEIVKPLRALAEMKGNAGHKRSLRHRFCEWVSGLLRCFVFQIWCRLK